MARSAAVLKVLRGGIFHRSGLGGGTDFDQLRQGDRVTFTAETDPRGKGPRGADVQLVTA